MNTGENEQGLRKIMDMTRLLSVVVLCLHIYLSCYKVFKEWGLASWLTDRILLPISRMTAFENWWAAKGSCLLLLAVSLIGVKGRKDQSLQCKRLFMRALIGATFYLSDVLLPYFEVSPHLFTLLYSCCSLLGFVLLLSSGTLLSRLLKEGLNQDIFNRANESFPQEERCLINEYSVNLPAEYRLKGRFRKSWINIINPFRGSLILGIPGSGKSYFVIRHFIKQHICKGFSMFIYDFKYDDLSRIAYNILQENLEAYRVKPRFFIINFEDLSRTHRCNPLDPVSMLDITDATEASRTIMLGLNREWIKKQGDFFVESPINFLTAIIWYLRKYRDGAFCTLPHVIELMQVGYKDLFDVLRREPEIEVLVNPFISAWQNEAFDQLEGQVASAKISMARLSSPALYYVLSGNDFTLDINNPEEPKIVCMGNNPQKQQVYGAVLSLYISRLIKLVNQKGKHKSSLIFDEFPTIYFNHIDSLIATARSNLVSTTLAVQDYSQLKKDYGREQAEVIMNIAGNILAGQVTGDTAKQLSERFGKIVQERSSISINSHDSSVSRSTQLDYAIPASRIAALSSGEFVGMVADNPGEKIELKVFHNAITNDHAAIQAEERQFVEIDPIRTVSNEAVQINFLQTKQDIQELLADVLGNHCTFQDPSLPSNKSTAFNRKQGIR